MVSCKAKLSFLCLSITDLSFFSFSFFYYFVSANSCVSFSISSLSFLFGLFAIALMFRKAIYFSFFIFLSSSFCCLCICSIRSCFSYSNFCSFLSSLIFKSSTFYLSMLNYWFFIWKFFISFSSSDIFS